MPPLPQFQSAIRGPWLTSVFGAVLLVSLPVITVTGLLSYIAYGPQFGQARPGDVGWLRLPQFDWPTDPSWIYRLNQGLHVTLGLVVIPLVLAKLWSVMPKLVQWPPVRSPAQALERLSLLMLVGGVLFEIVTGVLNIQYDYVFGFDFYTAHYFGAWVFIAGFLAHVAVKVPVMWRTLRQTSLSEVLRERNRAAGMEPEHEQKAPDGISRRGALALVAGGSGLLAALTIGQTIDGPLRSTALLVPAAAPTATGRTTSRSIARRSQRESIRRPPGIRGVWSCRERRAWFSTEQHSRRWISTPRYCRSRASRGGRRRRSGPGCACGTSPASPA